MKISPGETGIGWHVMCDALPWRRHHHLDVVQLHAQTRHHCHLRLPSQHPLAEHHDCTMGEATPACRHKSDHTTQRLDLSQAGRLHPPVAVALVHAQLHQHVALQPHQLAQRSPARPDRIVSVLQHVVLAPATQELRADHQQHHLQQTLLALLD